MTFLGFKFGVLGARVELSLAENLSFSACLGSRGFGCQGWFRALSLSVCAC